MGTIQCGRKANPIPSQKLPELDLEAEAEAMAEEFMWLSSFLNKWISLPALVLTDKSPSNLPLLPAALTPQPWCER